MTELDIKTITFSDPELLDANMELREYDASGNRTGDKEPT